MFSLLLLAIHISEPFLDNDAALRNCADYSIVLPDPCSSSNGVPMSFWCLHHSGIAVCPPYNGDKVELCQGHALQWWKGGIRFSRLKLLDDRSKWIPTTGRIIPTSNHPVWYGKLGRHRGS